MPADKPPFARFGTTCVRNYSVQDKPIHTHREAIYPTTAFAFPDSAEAMRAAADPDSGYLYSRWNNPTAEGAARAVAALETLGSGLQAEARLFASGMAAISAALMALLKPGQVVLTQPQLYGGTDELLRRVLQPWGVQQVRVDLNSPEELDRALREYPSTALVYAETPSNPMLYCADLAQLGAWAEAHKLPLVVDNTFATPYLQQPLALGARVVVHSATKFLNGHGSALGGVVLSTDLDWMRGPLFAQLKLLGASASPFDAWLLLSGLKTLELRMERHCANAARIAEFLEQHPAVAAVQYTGLANHPYHELATRQMRTHGAMLSADLKGGMEAARRLMDRVKVCSLATTLGTVDTLVQHPATMTHLPVPREQRLAQGIGDGLIRLSAGIENIEDILADLDQALA
jgi:methionine-gamma-lyase